MERTDHCVSSLGLVFRVLYTTSATCSSVIDRGAPERSSSCKPWSPFSRKRRRHLPTVARVTPTAAATASLGQPSAASRLISARRTNPWERLRDLAIDSNRSRSDGLSSNGGNGRPVTIGLSFQKGDKRNLRHLQLFVQLITRQDTRFPLPFAVAWVCIHRETPLLTKWKHPATRSASARLRQSTWSGQSHRRTLPEWQDGEDDDL